MICGCDHPIEAHGDRALFPACEGAQTDLGPLLVRQGEDDPYPYIRHAPRSRADACECKGFKARG